MSKAYKEPPSNFALRFCSLGCNNDDAQTEVNVNQQGKAMLPKINEKRAKQEQIMNQSADSDILEGISEKAEGIIDKRDIIQPSITQKNTLSSLKLGGSQMFSSRAPQNYGTDPIKSSFINKSDYGNKENLYISQGQDSNGQPSKPIVRQLGYGGSENAISEEDENGQQYTFINNNILSNYNHIEKDRQNQYSQNLNGIQQSSHYNNFNNGANNNIYDDNKYNGQLMNKYTINNHQHIGSINQINNNEYESQQDPQQHEILESTERFNVQGGSLGNMIYQNQKDLQSKFNQQEECMRAGDDNQVISPRFTEEASVYNNGMMQKVLMQKVLQDKMLINQIKSQNPNNQHGHNNLQSYQSIQSQREQIGSNSQRMQNELSSTNGKGIQDKYAQIMNGICLSKNSQAGTDDFGYDQQFTHQEVVEQNQTQQHGFTSNQSEQETFYPSKNQFSSRFNSLNPNNAEGVAPQFQQNNYNPYLQQKGNFQPNPNNIINSLNSFGEKFNPQQEESINWRQQQYNPHQNSQDQHQNQDQFNQQIYQQQQQYQMTKGYEVIEEIGYNSEMSERNMQYCDTMQVQALNGDRPLTIDSSNGTELTTASQKNIISSRNFISTQQSLKQMPQITNKIINIDPLNSMKQYHNIPLNVYQVQIGVQNQKIPENEFSEDIKCNYSQSINEIHPSDQEQKVKHYLHQHNQKKKRDLVTDSHTFNSFNNTNFFQNQTIQNPNNSNLTNSQLNINNNNSTNNNINNQNTTQQKQAGQNRVVNLSTNSEVHEYSKSKQLTSPVLDSNALPQVNKTQQNINNNPLQQFFNEVVPMNQSYHSQNNNEYDQEEQANRESIGSHTNINGLNQNIDMSHIMQKVNDIQGKSKEQQTNQVMLNSAHNTQTFIPSSNNYNSNNQYASSSAHNQTGNFDTARTVSQVHLNSNHFHDASIGNMNYNQINTLASSLDGRKKSDGIHTPKQSKNGLMSSNHNLQTLYTFKQMDTPEGSTSMQQQHLLINSNQFSQFPIKETDRALEQSELDGTLTNNYDLNISQSPNNHSLQERELRTNNMKNEQENESEEGQIPDDEYNHKINQSNLEIDPIYKLSPKTKSHSNQTNNQIYNQNAQRNLINSLQYNSNLSSQNGQQSFQKYQYQSTVGIKDSNFSSQYSSRQASPFGKLSVHLEKIEQVASPVMVDPSPKNTDPHSLTQFSPHRNNEEKIKKAQKQKSQTGNSLQEISQERSRQSNQNRSKQNSPEQSQQGNQNERNKKENLQQITRKIQEQSQERQRIEAALMDNDEDEDNQKLINYIYESELMKQHQIPYPKEKQSNYQQYLPKQSQQSMNKNYDLEEMNDPSNKLNTNQSISDNHNQQYLNGKFQNQFHGSNQHPTFKPSIQFENTPNFNSSIASNSNNYNKSQNYNQINTNGSINTFNRDQYPQNQNSIRDSNHIQVPTTHENNPSNHQGHKSVSGINNSNSLNKYFINPEYHGENTKINGLYRVMTNDPLSNFSQASSIRGNKAQPSRLTDNSRNNEWSQNNDGTIMFTRDGVDLPHESINENILLLNSSKALREKGSPSPVKVSDKQINRNQLFEPIMSHDNKHALINIDGNSSLIERKNRSPSPLQIKATKSSQLKSIAAQERIKIMNDKQQKKMEMINQREEELKRRLDEKEIKQDSLVKEQNKQLRFQNLKLKEQNELLKKQVENVISQNQLISSVQSGVSSSLIPHSQKQIDTVTSGRLNSTPHKQTRTTQKSPVQKAQKSKIKSPSLHMISANNQSHNSLNHSINKNANNNSLTSAPGYPVFQIQMSLSNNSSHHNITSSTKSIEPQSNNHTFSQQSTLLKCQMNPNYKEQNQVKNFPNQQSSIDISKILHQSQSQNTNSRSALISPQSQNEQISIKENVPNSSQRNNQSRKTSISDQLSQDHPKLQYSLKNLNSALENQFSINHQSHRNSNSQNFDSHNSNNINNQYPHSNNNSNRSLNGYNSIQQDIQPLSHNPSTNSIHSNNQKGSPKNESTRVPNKKSLHQDQYQVLANLQKPRQISLNSGKNKIYDSAENSYGDTNPMYTKDTSYNNNLYQNTDHQMNSLNHNPFKSQQTVIHPTKSSLSVKPNNLLFDSKNSTGYESLQIHMIEQISQKPSLNDTSIRIPDELNKKLDFSSHKKTSNNLNSSTKDSLSGNCTSSQTRNASSINSPNKSRKNDFMPKQIPQKNQNNNKSEYLLSSNNNSGVLNNNKSYGIRENVDKESSNLDSKYKLVQNVDNTFSLMKNAKPQQKCSFHGIQKGSSYKNNFMPRQYNPDELKNKSISQNMSQENSEDQNKQFSDSKNQQSQKDGKGQFKLVLVSPHQQSINNTKQNDGNNNRNILEKKHSTPSLSLPKTNSNLSIGLKSNRSSNQVQQPTEVSSNFINQNQSSYQLSQTQLSNKSGKPTSSNQLSKVPSSNHIRSQSYALLPQKSTQQLQNAGTPETDKLLNSAMNTIFQKIENCYDNISQGYDRSVNVLKKENNK